MIALYARARGDVVDHPTLGVGAAESRARVHTVKSRACLVRRAVRVDCALGTTCNIGVPKVVLDASAGSSSISIRAFSI